ncbi:MAG: bifunctional oligoribonuclease/PAP phosphatase NrnA [Collinsella sp.]|nr:bifunctional oligoribonuclease/PAP phosphatase NrnA [Collinsella sp.]
MSSTSPCMGRATTPDMWGEVIDFIEAARTIAISGHTSPDGDALGSALGLGLSLEAAFPEKEIVFLLADDAPVPRVYRFLEGADRMVPASSYEGRPDLFISVDSPTLERLADSAAVVKRALGRVVIDHHPSREEFGDAAVRVTAAAATAVLVEELIEAGGWPCSPSIATCLLTGLVTDTGRFQYQNANPAAFACASRLVDAGGDPSRISLEVYQSQRLEYLRLESVVMARIATVAEGRVAYSYAYRSDLEEFGVSSDECDGLIDVVRSVQGSELCLFLKESSEGVVRGNLRSKGKRDISVIAAAHNGGGHAVAAGFTFHGTVEEALSTILPELEALAEQDDR